MEVIYVDEEEKGQRIDSLGTPELAAACNFFKKGTLAQVFSYEFCEISKNTFSYRLPFVAAFDLSIDFDVFSSFCTFDFLSIHFFPRLFLCKVCL